MLVVMRHDATTVQVDAVVRTIEDMGYEARPMPGKQRTAIGLVGNDGKAQETVVARARDNGLAARGQWEGGGP